MNIDPDSFIAGLQVGRRIKAWDASVERESPKPTGGYIITEVGQHIVTESDSTPLITEGG